MIRKLKKGELKRIYKEYLKNDFPKDERKPYAMIERYSFNGKGDAVGYFKDETLIGYATVLFSNDILMLDYFAVLIDQRGKGIGTAFLKELKDYYSEYRFLTIEAESNDSEEALKRIKFYEKAGCINTGIKLKLYFVDYVILVFGEVNADLKSDIFKLYEDIYPNTMGTKYFRLLN